MLLSSRKVIPRPCRWSYVTVMHRAPLLRLVFLASILVLATFPVLQPASAQETASGQGIMVVSDWPDKQTRETSRFDILPFIDSLSVAYRFRVLNGAPDLSMVLEWASTGEAIFNGERTSLSEIEGTPAIVGLELVADAVSADGQRVAGFSLVVDSMIVEPSPDIIQIDLPDLNWENVFVDTPAERAREIFEAGFELRNPVIVSAGFAQLSGGEEMAADVVEEREKDRRRPPQVAPRRPRNVSVYRGPGVVDIGFDLFWLIGSGSRPIRVSDDGPRENIGRGSLGGRNRGRGDRADRPDRSRGDAEGRSSERDSDAAAERDRSKGRSPLSWPGSSKSDDDDDDDDDDDELVPYAVAAIAAAGALAVFGGTIGYYGSSRYAPIGLTSGFVGRDGGVLLQVAVNESLITDNAGPKRVMGRILGFGDLLHSPRIQPAIGGGVLLTSLGDEIEYDPSVSMGAVVRFDALLFYAGFDVMQNSPEFSVALNLRRLGLWGKK